MFVSGKPFQPGLMFLNNAIVYLSGAPFSCHPLGLALGLTHNPFVLAGKGQTRQLTLTICKLQRKKSFIRLTSERGKEFWASTVKAVTYPLLK